MLPAMLKLTAMLSLLSTAALADSAFWTGRVEYVTTVTYRQGVRCQYNYLGQTFWRTFTSGSCPSSVEVG